jgi:hypothetical protein
MRVQRRGKFRTLVADDGSPVRAELYNCVVTRTSTGPSGKAYVTLDLTHARGAGRGVLTSVDARVRREAAPEFSPLAGDVTTPGTTPATLVVKVPAGGCVKYETREGAADAPFDLASGLAVDAVLKLGVFGSFGYCWIVERVKPHDPPAE